MGVREIRQAFNNVAGERYNCRQAFSRYEWIDGKQFQILSFSGTGADGNSFVYHSEPFNPNDDSALVAAKAAQALVDKQEPLT